MAAKKEKKGKKRLPAETKAKARGPRAKTVVQTLSAGTIDVMAPTLNVVVGPKTAAIDIIVTPATVDIAAPELLVLTELLSQVQALRRLPPADPRRPAKEQYISEVLQHALSSWEVLQQRCTTAAHALAAGKTTEFLRVIERYSLIGFDQLRRHPTVKNITDGWCLDNMVNGEDSDGRRQLERLCQSLLRSLPGRRPTLLPAQQREQTRNRQHRFRVQTQKAVEHLDKDIAAAKRTLSARLDYRTRRREEARIEDALIAAALQNPDPHIRAAGESRNKGRARQSQRMT